LTWDTRVRTGFAAVLKAAELPSHFTPRALRHTCATLLLQDDVPITYITDQLGHPSIQMTVDTYGRWLPTGNRYLIDRLDSARPVAGARGDQSVTDFDLSEALAPELIDSVGAVLPRSASLQLTPM
jgi:hypothetical protein